MPRDSARAPQLPLCLLDTTASPEARGRYVAIRPVLKGERSLPQQSRVTGIHYCGGGGTCGAFSGRACWA